MNGIVLQNKPPFYPCCLIFIWRMISDDDYIEPGDLKEPEERDPISSERKDINIINHVERIVKC